MTRVNGHFKTVETTPAPAATTEDPAVAQARAALETATKEVEAYREENAQWLSEEDNRELDRLETTMKAESAAIDAYGVGAPGGAADDYLMPQNLDPEWNGAGPLSQSDRDRRVVEKDAAEYGAYAGTVTIPNSGSASDPTAAVFQMTDDMTGLHAKSRGRDIVLTAEYKDGTKKSWVIKDGSVSSNYITLSARGLTHAVDIDCSGVFRVGPGGYDGVGNETQGFFIWGTDYNDTIQGTQNADYIAGMSGDDNIKAWAGVDTVFGDEGYDVTGLNAYVPGSFDESLGGNDTIDGGAGDDAIYAEGGNADVVFSSDNGEAVYEQELTNDNVRTQAPDSFGIDSDNWEISDESEDGMTVIRNTTDNGGTIDMEMPEGYSMAYGEKSAAGDLIITFVGDKGTFKVKIEDFFGAFGSSPKEGIVRLNFYGGEGNDIIDFSNVDTTSQVINIIDDAGGEDVILGARNEFLSLGVDTDKPLDSQGEGKRILNRIVEDDGIFAPPYADDSAERDVTEENGRTARVEGNKIVISGSPEDDPLLNIAAPEGYTVGTDRGAYLTEDNDNFYVIMVKPDATGGDADTIVVKIDKHSVNNDSRNINVQTKIGNTGDVSEDWDPVNLKQISLSEGDYVIDGGTGHDLIYAQRGTRVTDSDEATYYEEESTPARVDETGGSGGETPATPVTPTTPVVPPEDGSGGTPS